MRRRMLPLLAGSLLLVGCGTETPAPSGPTTPSATASATSATPPSPGTSASPSPTASSPVTAAGKIVVLDPGHNGGNASHPAEINKPVPAGRGQTKPCNTTGTATNAGYPEHAFTFDVAQRVGKALAAKGIKVIYTRTDDSGVGPCVDVRAQLANDAHADAVVSIHGDGSNSASAHGFHVAYSSPPLNAEQGEPSTSLAKTVRDTLRAAGFPTSNYIGSGGLFPRADLAGLNLSTRPAVLVECGNMRNSAEAAAMSSADGRQHYADAIAQAIETYLA